MQNLSELYSPEGLFKLSNDVIDRNIKPFAKYEFENLIETFGNVKGANILKKILSLDSTLSEEELKNAENLIKAFFTPNRTMFKSEFRFKNSFARALLCLTLLIELQNHHKDLMVEKPQDASELKWVPLWTKSFANAIYKEIVLQGKQTDYSKTRSTFVTAVTGLVGYFWLFSGRDKEYKMLKFLAAAFVIMLILTFMSDKLHFKVDTYLMKKEDKDKFGYSYNEICELITNIKKYNPYDEATPIEQQNVANYLFKKTF